MSIGTKLPSPHRIDNDHLGHLIVHVALIDQARFLNIPEIRWRHCIVRELINLIAFKCIRSIRLRQERSVRQFLGDPWINGRVRLSKIVEMGLSLVRYKMSSFSNSWMATSGASGPETISKQLSNNACALSSAKRNSFTLSKGSPPVARAQTIPTVMLL